LFYREQEKPSRMNIFNTKSYADRLEAAIAKAEKAQTDLEAFQILGTAMRAEIALVNKITSMPMFRAWIEGERFDLGGKIKARK
jgi:hypothetical protein